MHIHILSEEITKFSKFHVIQIYLPVPAADNSLLPDTLWLNPWKEIIYSKHKSILFVYKPSKINHYFSNHSSYASVQSGVSHKDSTAFLFLIQRLSIWILCEYMPALTCPYKIEWSNCISHSQSSQIQPRIQKKSCHQCLKMERMSALGDEQAAEICAHGPSFFMVLNQPDGAGAAPGQLFGWTDVIPMFSRAEETGALLWWSGQLSRHLRHSSVCMHCKWRHFS